MATPYTTSCGIELTSIDGTDCIGDSRGYINNNVQNLGNAICTLTTNLTALSSSVNFNVQDSNTIDLTWNTNTKILSADVKPDSIRYSNLASWQTLSASPTLSAEAVQPRVAKAWVRFSKDAGGYTILNSFNVQSIALSGSAHRVFFTNLDATNCIITGSAGTTSDSGGTRYMFPSIINRGPNFIDFVLWANGGGGGLLAVTVLSEVDIIAF